MKSFMSLKKNHLIIPWFIIDLETGKEEAHMAFMANNSYNASSNDSNEEVKFNMLHMLMRIKTMLLIGGMVKDQNTRSSSY